MADLPPEEREFLDRLEHLTARVGRGILVAFPGTILMGLLLLPTGASAGVALVIIALGVAAMIIVVERAYGGRRTKGPHVRERSFLRTGAGRLVLALAVVGLIYLAFVLSVSN